MKMSELKINDFAKEVHENAVTHGWYNPEPSFGDVIALCHSELSEALQEYRAGDDLYIDCQGGFEIGECNGVCIGCKDGKPRGIEFSPRSFLPL